MRKSIFFPLFLCLVTLLVVLTACSPAPSNPPPEPTPTFVADKYGSSELDVTYCTPEEKAQKLDIYYPASGGPWPVFLYVHGGSWMEGDKAEGAGWRGLNDLGYVVVSINYRLAAEGKFPVMIEDVKCAVRYLRANSSIYNLDPTRFAALGFSAGGHLVALLGTAGPDAGWDTGPYSDQSSAVQAVVAMSGIHDLTVKLPSGLGTPIYYAFGALPASGKPAIAAASPVTYLDAGDPPFLIFHGDNDGVVPYEQSEILQSRLVEAGVASTLVIVKNGDHGLQGIDASPTQEEIYQAIVDFLDQTLE